MSTVYKAWRGEPGGTSESDVRRAHGGSLPRSAGTYLRDWESKVLYSIQATAEAVCWSSACLLCLGSYFKHKLVANLRRRALLWSLRTWAS